MGNQTHYDEHYIAGCRDRVETHIALLSEIAVSHPFLVLSSIDDLIVVLDASFVDRQHAMEGDEPNPMKQVQELASEILKGNPSGLDLDELDVLAAEFFAAINVTFGHEPDNLTKTK